MITRVTENARRERHEKKKKKTTREAKEKIFFHGLVIFWREN